MGQKRILYYSHTRQVSGGERVLLTMLAVLDRARYEAVCACPLDGPGELDAVLRGEGFAVVEAPVLKARFTSNPVKLVRYAGSIWGAIRGFRGTIVRVKPDLLHANSVRAGLVATLATMGMGTRVLWHVHDDLPKHPISVVIRRVALWSKRSEFVAVSQNTAKVFAGGLEFSARMHVLHNAVDTLQFPRKTAPLDGDARAVREELGVGADEFLAVAVGMINPRKGQLELVRTWGVVQGNLGGARRAHLAVVGAPIFNDDSVYEQKVHAQALLAGDGPAIRFTGPRKDIPAVLRAADLLVLNAAVEPFGLVLLEAIASGTPVVATCVGGIPEIVASGVTADLVAWANIDAYRGDEELGGALFAAVRDPERSLAMAERAYAEVLPRFTIAVFAENLQALYARLMAGEAA